ncbi:MAG: class I SAM-dependent methyltransferase [Syntrophobacteraceae bacterium]|nr:class I SAM-dependent methyltransferase [Syntrophobacteraceae bacterium]
MIRLVKQFADLFRTPKYCTSQAPCSPQALKIAYSCVVDAKPKFEWQAFLWVHSLLRNVRCDPFDLKIHCMPGVSRYFRQTALDLGVQVIDTAPFEGDHPYCNKIQQCFSGVFDGYARIIFTDADMFFLAPPQLPMNKSFAGKIVDLDNPPLEILLSLYVEAGIKPSKIVTVDCAVSRREKTLGSNLNGGFYSVDIALQEDLGRCWKKNALWILDRIERLGKYKAHVDQIAMAMTLDELKVDVAHLTAQVNFPAHLPKKRLRALPAGRIDVLHYHSSVTPNGGIKLTGVRSVDNAIAKANKDIAAIIEDNFDNALFWNNRYACFPELGSGLGSRDEPLEYKKERLSNVVHSFENASVLEIGCGDLETSSALNFKDYTGYDLSAAALEIARDKRPDWRFVQGSIDSVQRSPADLVMCIDVLIHQKAAGQYREMVYQLARATKRRLIVSGFESSPSLGSSITAYHEPLSATLRGTGMFNEIIEIGTYRDTSLFVADTKPTGPALHPTDIPIEVLNAVLPLVPRPDLLCAAMDCSREHLGFFTNTPARAIEYPWLLETLGVLTSGARILDIGPEVTPLPIMLAERGMRVHTLNSRPLFGKQDSSLDRNEWGFMDSAEICPDISSSHVDLLDFHPPHQFDVIFSINLFEHLPRPIWEQTIGRTASWLEHAGMLLFTVGLIPGTNSLWNIGQGEIVAPGGSPAVPGDIEKMLGGLGVEIVELTVQRNIPYSATDVAFVRGKKS